MNYGISVLFRAIPLAMGAICLGFGFYILSGGQDFDHLVAGHVILALTAICFALFTTAATIIRQLIHRYGPFWVVALPLAGYLVALATMGWGIFLVFRGSGTQDIVAGHVVFAIGLIAACVSTVAAASTSFVLIRANNARKREDGPPEGAYSRTVGFLLIAVPCVCATIGFALAYTLLSRGGDSYFVAGHVVFGLSAICASLIALVATIVRQIRNTFTDTERYWWTWLVVLMGTINVGLGLYDLFGETGAFRIAPGVILIGLGMICFSILSKALLLAVVWRKSFPLANRIPLLPVGTALGCLFFAAFLFEAAQTDPAFYIGSGVLVGLGAVCFTLFSIVSILEAGTSD